MTEKEEEQLSTILEGHRGERNGLIPILLDIQKEFGYLPKEAMLRVAKFLGMKPVEVWGVSNWLTEGVTSPTPATDDIRSRVEMWCSGGRLGMRS